MTREVGEEVSNFTSAFLSSPLHLVRVNTFHVHNWRTDINSVACRESDASISSKQMRIRM